MKFNLQVQLQFTITQHIKDAQLMYDIQTFFKCGYIVNDTPTKLQYRIRGIKDITEKLLPLFDMYPLHTRKSLDLIAFKDVHAIMLSGGHLTLKGLKQIKQIKSTMNRARVL